MVPLLVQEGIKGWSWCPLLGPTLHNRDRCAVFPVRGWAGFVPKQLAELTKLRDEIGALLVLPDVLALACERLPFLDWIQEAIPTLA